MNDLEFWDAVYLSVIKNGATTHDALTYADTALNGRKQRQSESGRLYTDERLNNLLLSIFKIQGDATEYLAWGFTVNKAGDLYVIYSKYCILGSEKTALGVKLLKETSLIEILKDHG